MYDKITYRDVLNQKLNVMDLTAISLCMEEDIPILVFNILEKGNLKKVLIREDIEPLYLNKKKARNSFLFNFYLQIYLFYLVVFY